MVTLVIPLYVKDKSTEEIKFRCIKSLKEHTKDCVVVIVDDASPVKSERIKKLADKYLEHTENMGFAVSCNDGLDMANTKYICVVNDDVEAYEKFIPKMIDFLSETVVLVSPAVYNDQYDMIWGVERRHPSGCCILGTTETWDRYGGFSEEFGKMYFEDTDLLTRVEKDGKRWLTTDQSIVYHYGQQSFDAGQFTPFYWENHKKFIKKWGFDPIKKYYE